MTSNNVKSKGFLPVDIGFYSVQSIRIWWKLLSARCSAFNSRLSSIFIQLLDMFLWCKNLTNLGPDLLLLIKCYQTHLSYPHWYGGVLEALDDVLSTQFSMQVIILKLLFKLGKFFLILSAMILIFLSFLMF